MSNLFRCGLLGILLYGAPCLYAHDFWVQPARFQLDQPVTSLPILLQVGDDFRRGDLFPRDRFHMKRFFAWGPAGQVQIGAPSGRLSRLASRREGKRAAGSLRLTGQGLYVIGYESQPTPAVLEGKLFRRYLDKEGFQELDLHDPPPNGKETPVVELYSRCAKSLVQVGSAAAGANDRRLGFPLELLAERNPYQMVPGTDLRVRIFYRGRPLSDATITALHQPGKLDPIKVEADSQGRASFQLQEAGIWMIRAVHLVSADSQEADFQSYWASLTFELPTPSNAR